VGILYKDVEIYVSAKSAEGAKWRDFQGAVSVNGIELPASDMEMTVENVVITRTKTSVRVSAPGWFDITMDIARASFWTNGPGANFVSAHPSSSFSSAGF
jgi:hypothetical protein